MKRFVPIFVLLMLAFSFVAIPKAEAAATYSINIVQANAVKDAYSTICNDDTCDEDEVLYYIDFDVSGRGVGQANAVTVDIYISADTNLDWSTATMTATGSFYTTSYVPSPGWWCTLQVNTQMQCAAKIDDDTNPRITLRGRQDAAYECASADHTTDPLHPPSYNRSPQADLYKHTDPMKSASDYDVTSFGCLDGNTDVTINNSLSYNGTGYYRPTGGTPYGFATARLFENAGLVPGPITYDAVWKFPTWVTVTSCSITNNGSTWYSPYNPPTCTITDAGKTVTSHFKFGSNLDATVNFTGNIGSIPECPSTNTFTKHLFDDQYVTRNIDTAWRNWGYLNASFKCQ